MNVNPTHIAEVMDFRGAYGRLCSLAAQAMKEQNVSREAVRYALAGEGDYIALGPVRAQRRALNAVAERAVAALLEANEDMTRMQAFAVCIRLAREARTAVESEWGHSLAPGGEVSPWQHLSLPIVQVRS